MKVNDWRRVVVRVSDPSAPPDFEAGLPGSGEVIGRDVKVGSDLIADLVGSDFNIVRVGHDDGKRTLATGKFAEWQWDVQPLRSGQKTLSLILYVRLQDGGAPLDVKTFDEQVEVQVNPIYTVANWAKNYWTATGLTIPVIVAAIWAIIQRRRRASGPATDNTGPPDSAPSRRRRLLRTRSRRFRPRRKRPPH